MPSMALARHDRSPIKKHLSGAPVAAAPVGHWPLAASAGTKDHAVTKAPPLGSPQKLKATVAECATEPPPQTRMGVSSLTEHALTVAPVPVTEAGATRHVRAAMLQAVLGLLDHEDRVLLEEILPLLRALTTLPLEDAGTRRACLAALEGVATDQTAAGPATASSRRRTTRQHKQTHSLSVLARPPPQAAAPAQSRESGRPKSAVSLHHCKEFLLACANEIHELEEWNPCFDYAETCSEGGAATSQRTPPPSSSAVASKRQVLMPGGFDYASVVETTSSVLTTAQLEDDDDDPDDAQADQGTQLSELLCRATDEFGEDQDAQGATSQSTAAMTRLQHVRDRLVCRRAFDQWRRHRSKPTAALKDAVDLARLFRAFTALKHHRATSHQSVLRKRMAFHRLRRHASRRTTASPRVTITRLSPATVSPPPTTVVATATPWATWTRALGWDATRRGVHWDVLALVLVAWVIHAILTGSSVRGGQH